MKGNLVSLNGCIVQLLNHPCACPCDMSTNLSVQLMPLALFLTAHLMGFSMEFDLDSSMESIWNSTWICNINSLEIPWVPHGPVHGIHMECTIPWTFLMDSIVGME